MEKFVFLTAVLAVLAVASAQQPTSGPVKKWWEHATIYQIYPRSFKDSNGDGIGDLPGITSRLQHLADIGIDTIWMSPMFQSPLKDFGYDVSDFYAIHDEYGTMADFDAFIKRATELGIGVLLDFVPNHTSNEMDWFVKSENREGKYTDYYVWHDGGRDANGNRIAPNNWRSVFGGSTWTWSEKRQQWYFHQFYPEQPDLNYRNHDVVVDMNNVFNFWLRRGIAGFRVDAFNHLFEHRDFPDEPVSGYSSDSNSYEYLLHIYTKDQQETYEMLYNWRKTFDEFTRDNNVTDKILMVEAYASIEDTMRYYRSENGTLGSQMPFNFQLAYVDSPPNAVNIKQNIDYWYNHMPPGLSTNWVTGSHDHPRVGSRLGIEVIDSMATICLMLPGVSVTYYGEEIGMIDNEKQSIVVDNRDRYRTPMQWDSTVSSGFSTNATTWLLVHENYPTINVDTQRNANRSTYHHFRELSALRREPTIIHGDVNSKVLHRDVLAFTREYPDLPTYVVLVNVGKTAHVIDLKLSFFDLPQKLIVASSAVKSPHRIGDELQTTQITLSAYDSLVLRVSSGAAFVHISIMAVVSAVFLQFLV